MNSFLFLFAILLNGCTLPRTSSMTTVHSMSESQGTKDHPDDLDQALTNRHQKLTNHPDGQTPTTVIPNCTYQQLRPEDVVIHKKKGLFLKEYNITVPSGEKIFLEPTLNICFGRTEVLNREIFKVCPKFEYGEEEFEDLGNGKVRLYEDILDAGTFQIKDGVLSTCIDDYDNPDDNSTGGFEEDPKRESVQDQWSIYVGQVGSGISILALIAHLVAFCIVPTLRNVPGYNLAALSVAFLCGFFFRLLGQFPQIPQTLGFECKATGIIQQYFFLVAFFCMNTLAFDVWRNLKRAATKLSISSRKAKKRQFVFYSIYSWGFPFFISAVTVSADNIKGVPRWIRPEFGKNNYCWMNNRTALMVFFAGPAFTLFVLNAVFFVMSALIVKNNTMKLTSDDQNQTARLNFVLYLRLGLMMGVTWLLGLVAALSESSVLWIGADLLNSLQGLFIFLMFTCTKKVSSSVRERIKTSKSSSTEIPNFKGLSLGDARTPKTSTTDIPSLKDHTLESTTSHL